MSLSDRIRGLFGLRRRGDLHDSAQFIPVPRFGESRAGAESAFPAFASFANEDDANLPLARTSSHAVRIGRAFMPSQPISSLRNFAGRKQLIGSIIRTIENRRMHVVLYGNRGMGKTSLLQIIALLARDAQYLVRYSSCSANSDFDSTFRTICADIPLLYDKGFDPTSDQVEQGKNLGDLLGPELLTPARVSEVFARVTGTRILLILDEFDRATSAEFRLAVAELIKNLSDRATRVQLLIGGVASNLNELIEHIPSVRRNVLGVPIGEMSADELLEIIANGETISGLTFTPEAKARIVELALGSPYLTSLIAESAGEAAIDGGSLTVSGDHVRSAASRLVQEFLARLSPDAIGQLEHLRRAIATEKAGNKDLGKALASAGTNGVLGWNGSHHEIVDDSVPTILWLEREAA